MQLYEIFYISIYCRTVVHKLLVILVAILASCCIVSSIRGWWVSWSDFVIDKAPLSAIAKLSVRQIKWKGNPNGSLYNGNLSHKRKTGPRKTKPITHPYETFNTARKATRIWFRWHRDKEKKLDISSRQFCLLISNILYFWIFKVEVFVEG